MDDMFKCNEGIEEMDELIEQLVEARVNYSNFSAYQFERIERQTAKRKEFDWIVKVKIK